MILQAWISVFGTIFLIKNFPVHWTHSGNVARKLDYLIEKQNDSKALLELILV
jgi:hypothetical protein